MIFASADDAAMAELKSRLPILETAETKKSLGFHSAQDFIDFLDLYNPDMTP